VSTPTDHVYFRAISVTAVLAKVNEKTVVRQFLQPRHPRSPSMISLHLQRWQHWSTSYTLSLSV